MAAVQPETTTSSATELLASGRRHLAVREYSTAVSVLADACEALSKEHGEATDPCGEAYLWYGKALLGLSREESGVLGDGMPGSNNADEEDGEDGDQEENGEAEPAENGKNGEEETNEVESTTKDEVSTSEAEPKTNRDVAEPGMSNGEANGGEEEADIENEDDIDNLQLAWEMLDLARGIFSKRVSSNAEGPAGAGAGARALLAEVHLALGEVALESETYDKAVVDMLSCLELQKELYCSDDRRIAETHYQIGLANSLASNFEDAITHFKNAANILETRIKTLQNPTSASEDAAVKKPTASDATYSVEGEIKELKELLPEIQEKIQDMMDYKAETKKRLREQLMPSNGDGASSSSAFSSNGAGSSSSSASEAKAKPAADISHLIKRKRKSSENEPEGSAPKRTNT